MKNSTSLSSEGVPSGGYYVFLIIYLVLLSAFGSFVNDMYLPTLPEMVRSFHTSRPVVQLGLTFGMVGLGVGELILGPLSDRFGRKPILIWALVVVAAAQFACFYLVDNVWVYEALNLPMLFCLGMLFTVGNTLAMNEGRDCAGDASALIGLMGYVFGATVSPLVGLGNTMHSTAITIMALSVLVLVFTRMTRVLPADLEATPQSASRTAEKD